MSRRRALMAAEEKTDLLYSIDNLSVTTGAMIDTGVKAFASGQAVTILLDFTNSENPTTSGDAASTWKAIGLWVADANTYGVCIGKSKNTATYQKIAFLESIGDGSTITGSQPSTGRHRYAVTHAADATTLTLKYRKGTGTVQTVTETAASFIASNTNKLYFGSSGINSLPAGTIHSAKVYGRVLSAEEINEFLGV